MEGNDNIYSTVFDSPVGFLKISANNKFLYEISFTESSPNKPSKQKLKNPILQKTRLQLEEYFSGKRKEFDLPLDLRGTDFQNTVWSKLMTIPYSKTKSYGEVAVMIGNPKAPRAVGMANNKNKIVIVIPCHRVVGAQKKLVGYGGGLDKKRWLLEHEGAAFA